MKNKIILSMIVISLLFISGFAGAVSTKYVPPIASSSVSSSTGKISNTQNSVSLNDKTLKVEEVKKSEQISNEKIVNNNINAISNSKNTAIIPQKPRRDDVIDECGVVIEEEGEYTLEEDLDCSSDEFREQEISAITINADDVVLDCDGYSIIGPGDLDWDDQIHGVYAEEISGIIIRNCEISDFSSGIKFYHVEESEIINNNLNENSDDGIYLEYSDSNTLTGNTANENGWYGIDLQISFFNTIRGNIVNENSWGGISLWLSVSNTIIDNEVNGNNKGIYLEESSYSNNILSNVFCYNERSDISIGERSYDNQFLYNQCDNIESDDDIECMPCDIEQQEIQLNLGWNLISSYLVPYYTDMEAIFGPLARKGELSMVKDEDGNFMIPARNFNNIGEWNPQEGYYVKVSKPTTLTIKGEEHINPQVELKEGWNYIAYPLTEARDMDDIRENVLSPLIENNILEIIKNWRGDFFAPKWNFNGIDEMKPGQGYQVRVTEDSVINFGE